MVHLRKLNKCCTYIFSNSWNQVYICMKWQSFISLLLSNIFIWVFLFFCSSFFKAQYFFSSPCLLFSLKKRLVFFNPHFTGKRVRSFPCLSDGGPHSSPWKSCNPDPISPLEGLVQDMMLLIKWFSCLMVFMFLLLRLIPVRIPPKFSVIPHLRGGTPWQNQTQGMSCRPAVLKCHHHFTILRLSLSL